MTEQADDFLEALAKAIDKHLGLKPPLPKLYMIALAMNRMGFVIVPKQTIKAHDAMYEALKKARVAIATWSPNSTEPLEEIDAALRMVDHQSAGASSDAVSEADGPSPERDMERAGR